MQHAALDSESSGQQVLAGCSNKGQALHDCWGGGAHKLASAGAMLSVEFLVVVHVACAVDACIGQGHLAAHHQPGPHGLVDHGPVQLPGGPAGAQPPNGLLCRGV
jgi:hypothetical protein